MVRAVDSVLSRAFGPTAWLLPHKPRHDVTTVLAKALGPAWSVQRQTDCEGEVSIIVLPLDDSAEAAFVLYERDGVVRVATIAGDDRDGDRGFSGLQAAVAAIIAEIARPPSPVRPRM